MSLAKTQALSLATKAVTTALGIVQSVIVIRLLTPAEFGLVGLVMSIGGVIGVTQHLGIVDGAIREIAILKNRAEAAKAFWVSNLVRQAVTIPLSLGLIVLASLIATRIYDRPDITPYLQIFAAVLILQGLQDVFGATLTGLKKFRGLYLTQIITAAINIAVFGYLTWRFATAGFFWAIVITTTFMVAIFTALLWQEFKGHLALPSSADIKRYAGKLIRIGIYLYAARIAFVVWQRLPLLLLGAVLAATELGFINVSLTFGSRLTIIAMALSEVNLAWMSTLFTTNRDQFQRAVTRNMQRVFIMMLGLTATLLFFTPEIIQYVIGPEYAAAHPIILIMTAAFFLYALVDIGTSSLFVPADQPRTRAALYLTMIATSAALIAWLLIANPSPLLASLAVLAGAAVSYAAMIVVAKRRFRISFLNVQLTTLLALFAASVIWLLTEPAVLWRILIFIALAGYTIREILRSNLLPQIAKIENRKEKTGAPDLRIVCFAGAFYDAPTWTNRQHVMSRIAAQHPVLYIEPRVWIVRYLIDHWRQPKKILRFLKRIAWFERVSQKSPPPQRGPAMAGKVKGQMYVKSQFNIIPGSRESAAISWLNHTLLNRWNVLFIAKLLGFRSFPQTTNYHRHSGIPQRRDKLQTVMWLYDTEAAEYLSAFKNSTVVYDCVDDHAAQAGVDRNPDRVREEEQGILRRADLVTTTSHKLYEEKKSHNPNTHLVLNAGDVELFTPLDESRAGGTTATLTPARQSGRLTGQVNIPLPKLLRDQAQPIIGTVGALDSYKIDFDLLYHTLSLHPEWQLVLIGKPIVERSGGRHGADMPLVRVRRPGSAAVSAWSPSPPTGGAERNSQRPSEAAAGAAENEGADAGQRRHVGLPELTALPNVHVYSDVPRRHVPAYVHRFNVCLIPYRNNDYNRASFPLKFWEFMATGIPIIATGVPELRVYESLIHYTEHTDQFIDAIKQSLANPHTARQARIDEAKTHTWQHRVDHLLSLLHQTARRLRSRHNDESKNTRRASIRARRYW